MILTLTPEDIIKRCLWNNYKRFILNDKSNEEIVKIVENNEPFSLSENDAYVIGLLKVVETDNLIHRFKEIINEVIQIKSTIQKVDESKHVLINKSTILKECISFKNNFPENYTQDDAFKSAINDVTQYINKKVKEVDKLETIEIMKNISGNQKKITYIQSSKIHKLFKVNSIDD
jgi:hypothetical protein